MAFIHNVSPRLFDFIFLERNLEITEIQLSCYVLLCGQDHILTVNQQNIFPHMTCFQWTNYISGVQFQVSLFLSFSYHLPSPLPPHIHAHTHHTANLNQLLPSNHQKVQYTGCRMSIIQCIMGSLKITTCSIYFFFPARGFYNQAQIMSLTESYSWKPMN